MAVHGDDFIAEGLPEGLDNLDAVISENFDAKVMPRIGPGASQLGKYLGRLIRWSSSGFTFELEE
eukprot:3553530-Amphidinium_carterae.1